MNTHVLLSRVSPLDTEERYFPSQPDAWKEFKRLGYLIGTSGGRATLRIIEIKTGLTTGLNNVNGGVAGDYHITDADRLRWFTEA